MTEPFFDHERFDVCELAGEYEYERMRDLQNRPDYERYLNPES